MAAHEPGLALNEGFYRDVVAGLLAGHHHSAALFGSGSEVLGYDNERSTDHGWGPRLLVFVDPALVAPVRRLVDRGLPPAYRGWPVRYGWDRVPVDHHVTVTTLPEWCRTRLGVVPGDGMSALDWLCLPQQRLLETTAGRVYADPDGELADLRSCLAYYPEQVWRWLLACQWQRIAEEEAFVGRCAEVGDDLGSRLVAARLVRDLMRLAFLLEQRYWPYGKWFGRAFTELPDPDGLGPALAETLAAAGYPGRERALVRAYAALAARFNAAGVSPPVDPRVRAYHQRPFRVLMAQRFAAAALATVSEPRLTGLALVGSLDQAVDVTQVLEDVSLATRMRSLYDPRPPAPG